MKDCHNGTLEIEPKEHTKLTRLFDSDVTVKLSLSILKTRCREYFRVKYKTNQTTFGVKVTNDIVFNEKCKMVALFKDYLIYDDISEFLRRYYTMSESIPRLEKILHFYETYSKIFPNYIIIPESVYLYKSIRKKQKMIDACNQIKLEEEENRKQIGYVKKKGDREGRVFDSSIIDSILKCQPSLTNDKQDSFSVTSSMSKFSPSASLNYNKNILENEESSLSIANIINIMDSKCHTYFSEANGPSVKMQMEGSVSKARNEKEIASFNNNRKKCISHKVTASVPEIQGGGIKIINHFQNIILPQGSTLISINNNFFNCDNSSRTNRKFNLNLQPPKLEMKITNDDNHIVYTKTEASVERNNYTRANTLSNDYFTKIYMTKMNQILQNAKSPKGRCLIPQKSIQKRNIAMPLFKESRKTLSSLPLATMPNTIKGTEKLMVNHTSKILKENQIKFIQSSSVKKNELINYRLQYDKNNQTKINPILLTETSPVVNMQTENYRDTERAITVLSKNEMKQKYKIFLKKNKLECLTSRNSTDADTFRQRMSIQVASIPSRKSEYVANCSPNVAILSPLAKPSINMKSSLKHEILLSPENDRSVVALAASCKNSKITDFKKLPSPVVKDILSARHIGSISIASKNAGNSIQTEGQPKNRIKKITVNNKL